MSKGKTRTKVNKKRIVRVLGLTLLALYFIIVSFKQKGLEKNLQAKKENYESEINKLEEDIKGLEEEIAYSDSLKFVEKIARDELGMVKPREIIVIDKNKKGKQIFNLNRSDD